MTTGSSSGCTNAEAGDWQRVIGKGDLGSERPANARSLGRRGAGKRLLYQIYTDGGASLSVFSNATVEIGQWSHVVVTKQGTTGTIYVNGQLDVQATVSGTIRTDTSPLVFGRDPWRHAAFPGLLDEISLHNRALTPAEIQQLFNSRNGTGVTLADNHLTKQGTGTVTRNAVNGYEGNTTVAGGTLVLAHPASSNTIAQSPTITVGNGTAAGRPAGRDRPVARRANWCSPVLRNAAGQRHGDGRPVGRQRLRPFRPA